MLVETVPFKYQIGDRIVGKKTGSLTPSTVYGVLNARLFKNVFTNPSVFYDWEAWSGKYPDWQDKNVYICGFDEPTKPMTLHEFIDSETSYIEKMLELKASGENIKISDFMLKLYTSKDNLWREFLKDQYNMKVRETYLVAYPEDDIELI